MNINKPPKPKFSKVMIIYTVLISCFFLIMVVSGGFDWAESDDIQGCAAFVAAIILPMEFYLIYYIPKYKDYKLAQTDYDEYCRRVINKQKKINSIAQAESDEIDREKDEAIRSQNAIEPWAVKYSTSPCPYCGHYKVRCAKWEDKSISIAFWGIASSKIGTNYKCEHCKQMWE